METNETNNSNNPRKGKKFYSFWLSKIEEEDLVKSLELIKNFSIREGLCFEEFEMWEKAHTKVSEILAEVYKRGDFLKR